MDADSRRLDAISGVFVLARDIRRHISELLAEDELAAELRFRPPCMGVLAVVAALQPVSQREISDQLGRDASDVVSALDTLQAAALVERRRDPQDRRRHAVVLTEQGELAAHHFDVLRARAEARALSALEPGERQQLAELLNRAVCRHAVPEPAGQEGVAPSV